MNSRFVLFVAHFFRSFFKNVLGAKKLMLSLNVGPYINDFTKSK
jgi:hypothetical protein